MKLDPTVMKDWEIAEAAEQHIKPMSQLTEELGLQPDEVIPMGRNLAKVDFERTMGRIGGNAQGKYVDVTAITPTPLGEGKTTTVMGLVQGLGHTGRQVVGAIRQPSGGPTFNIKGSAAGGGLAQCIPLTEFSMGLTGDIDAIANAHNLAMVALNARMQHERNYDDARLAKSNLTRLDIDPDRVQMKWVLDFCAQGLRNIRVGRGGKMDGFEMDSGFQITVSSEVMAILAVSRNLRDMRERTTPARTCRSTTAGGSPGVMMADTCGPTGRCPHTSTRSVNRSTSSTEQSPATAATRGWCACPAR